MKRRYSLLLALTGILAYFILLPRDLAPAFTLTPEAAYDLRSPRGAMSDGTIPFATTAFVGFLDESGRPLYVESVRYGAAASANGFINYDSVSSNLVIRDSEGGMLTPIDTRGYPFYLDQRLLVISTDRLRLKEYSMEGEVLWQIEAPSLITTVSGTDTRTVIGMLNGDYWFLDAATGEILYRYETEGSRIRVAYGSAVDAENGFTLIVAGAAPQQALLLEERGGELRQLQQFELSSDLRRNVQIFTPLEDLFVIEQEEALLLLDQSTLKRRSVDLPGILLDVDGIADENLITALVRRPEGEALVLVGPESGYRAELTLPTGAGAAVEIIGDRLILLLGDRVLVYGTGRI